MTFTVVWDWVRGYWLVDFSLVSGGYLAPFIYIEFSFPWKIRSIKIENSASTYALNTFNFSLRGK